MLIAYFSGIRARAGVIPNHQLVRAIDSHRRRRTVVARVVKRLSLCSGAARQWSARRCGSEASMLTQPPPRWAWAVPCASASCEVPRLTFQQPRERSRSGAGRQHAWKAHTVNTAEAMNGRWFWRRIWGRRIGEEAQNEKEKEEKKEGKRLARRRKGWPEGRGKGRQAPRPGR